MYRRTAVIILKENRVLMVKLKEQDRFPRATWVFPYTDLKETDSPRKTVNDMLLKMGLRFSMTEKVFRYSPSENPKINYITYIVKYEGGEPDVSDSFQTFKWVELDDIVAYSTSFMDGNVSKYLNEVKEKLSKFSDQ